MEIQAWYAERIQLSDLTLFYKKSCSIQYLNIFFFFQVFSGEDFVGNKNMKAPPSEKPPPVPPINDAMSSNIDEEIDKQEQAIIASLEMEEREHKRYMETQEKMRSKIWIQLSIGLDN